MFPPRETSPTVRGIREMQHRQGTFQSRLAAVPVFASLSDTQHMTL
jgi:hypothetical protein